MIPRTICFIVPLLWIMRAHVSAKPWYQPTEDGSQKAHPVHSVHYHIPVKYQSQYYYPYWYYHANQPYKQSEGENVEMPNGEVMHYPEEEEETTTDATETSTTTTASASATTTTTTTTEATTTSPTSTTTAEQTSTTATTTTEAETTTTEMEENHMWNTIKCKGPGHIIAVPGKPCQYKICVLKSDFWHYGSAYGPMEKYDFHCAHRTAVPTWYREGYSNPCIDKVDEKYCHRGI